MRRRNPVSNLRPEETIHKLLISTTSRLAGEYDSDQWLITHAWPDFSKVSIPQVFHEGPTSRSAYVIVFTTGPLEIRPGVPIPNYSPTGDMFCGYLSILFGKRFDNHGLLESYGRYQLPHSEPYSDLHIPSLPQIRFALLQFMQLNGINIDDRLKPSDD